MNFNLSADPKRTGQEPARRPPDDEPERVGEGELDEKPRPGPLTDSSDKTGEDEDLLDSD